MEYEVKVKGTEDVERLDRAITSLESVLNSTKGSGKALEEVRRIVVGFKGQASVFHELSSAMKTIPSAAATIENSMKGVGSAIVHTLKSEMALSRQVLRTEMMTLLKGIGSPLAAKIEGEVGGAMAEGIERSGKRAKSAAAKVRAEMTRQYEMMVGGDGFKQLSKDELGEVALFKGVGANISPFHAAMLKNEEESLRSQRRVLEAFKSVEEQKLRITEASVNKQRQIDRMFEDAQVAHAAKLEATAVRQAQALEKAREKELQTERQFNNALVTEQNKRVQEEERVQQELARVRMTFAKAYADYQAAQIRKSVSAAMNVSDAPYQKYSASTGLAGATVNMPKAVPAAKTTVSEGLSFDTNSDKIRRASAEMQLFAAKTGDAHAAVRGLASGFNLLWLTWGNLGPLMAGAALSNTFMKSAKEGMEVAHTLSIIRVLGEATGEEIDRLSAKLEHLGTTSIFGPKATAEAMQTLVLAGMKAADVIDQVANVQNFSVAGTTSIQNASDVLVSVTTAFGTGAAGIQKSSDIIVRAAADSKASVESFGEAMKTASVVGEQYGASQEDVAAMISMLANLGIQGTAAGTAIRNMYSDLSGRTPKVTKALKQMGLDFRDSNGNMKPLLQTVQEMDGALKRLENKDPKRAKDFLATILSERGGKAMVAALAEYNQKIVTADGVTSALELRLEKLGQVAGTTGLAAAELAETTQSAWKRVGATLETSLEKAFKNMEPQLYSMANSMQRLFNSEEFIKGVTTIASAVAHMGEAIATNSKMIGTAIAVWGGYKLATALVLPALTGVAGAASLVAAAFRGKAVATAAATAATAANTGATVANTLAQTGAATVGGTLLRGLAGFARLLPVIGLGVTAATIAWDAYATAKARANGVTGIAYERAENVIKSLNKQTEAMNERTKAIREGADPTQALALSESGKEFDAETLEYRTAIAAATKQIAVEEAQLAKLRKQNGADSTDPRSRGEDSDPMIDSLKKSIEAQKRVRREAQNNLSTLTEGYNRARGEFVASSARMQEATEKEASDKQSTTMKAYKDMLKRAGLKDVPDGPDDFGQTTPGTPRGPSAASQYYDVRYEGEKKLAEARQKLNEAYYAQGRLSAEAYYDFLESKAEESYRSEKRALEEKRAALKGDPKSSKAYEDAGTSLLALDLNYQAEITRLENERTRAVQDRLTASQKIQAFGNDYLASMENDGSRMAAITMSAQDAEVETARTKIARDFAKQRVDTEKNFLKEIKGLSLQATLDKVTEYNLQLEQLRNYEAQAKEIRIREIEDEKRARLQSSHGVTRAVGNYVNAAADIASQAENLTTTALKGMEDAFVRLATTGKLSFSDMANSIIADMARIASKQVASGLSGLIGQGVNFLLGGIGGGAGNAGWGDYSSKGLEAAFSSPVKNAKGGVYNSPSLSSYSNTVHSSPKLFAFAQGGVFGEAGPEAIMPLTRGADGNLGVRQFGGGSGGGDVIINFELIQNGGQSMTTKFEQSKGPDGNMMVKMVQDVVSDDLAGNGKIARSIKKRFRLPN